ncbi:MAG: C-terminal binding protein [Clostridiales bacterium]|nr:C-terminal binding protein [Clostridiales bacterium]
MKVVVTDRYANGEHFYDEAAVAFKEAGIDFVLANCSYENNEETIEACKDADAVIVSFNSMAAEVVEKFEKCKIIARTGVGVDVVDQEACSKKGIYVCNVPDYCMDEVATHAMALILSMERKTCIYNNQIRTKGNWDCGYGYRMHRLSDMTLGIVGFGRISSKLATFAKGFGFKIIASDPITPAEVMAQYGVEKVSQDELFAQADVISIHVPLLPSTHHLICKETIAKMKDGVRIVNTSRGPVISTEDLIEGLKSGKIAAAGLDVIEGEKITDPNAEILKYENVIVTPHAAFQSIAADKQLSASLVEEVIDRLSGRTPKNIVNKKGLEKYGFLK